MPDWARVLQHLPWGMWAGWLTFGAPLPLLLPIESSAGSIVAGSLILFVVLAYEAFNDWRKNDKSYWDVLGIVWGYIISVTALILLGRLL